jgi:dTDP-glucose 4,6-dehydratase
LAERRFLVTGGTGFIGSALVRHLIGHTGHEVPNFDKLAYPAAEAKLGRAAGDPRYSFQHDDLNDFNLVGRCLADFRPDVVIHLPAEAHVDRSIRDPRPYLEANICGTYTLFEARRRYWTGLDGSGKAGFRFHQVSTDEVFGSIDAGGSFTEEGPYRPRSPYAASKAAADHLASAWEHTYGLPVVITHSTNNHGPCQYPEKLIARTIVQAFTGRPLPIYGSGPNVRDWLYVDNHAAPGPAPGRDPWLDGPELHVRRPHRAPQHRRDPGHLPPPRPARAVLAARAARAPDQPRRRPAGPRFPLCGRLRDDVSGAGLDAGC